MIFLYFGMLFAEGIMKANSLDTTKRSAFHTGPWNGHDKYDWWKGV